MNLSLELAFEYQAVSPAEIWQTIIAGLPSAFPIDGKYMLEGKQTSLDRIGKKLQGNCKPHFGLEIPPNGEVDFGAVGSLGFSILVLDCIAHSNASAIALMDSLSRVRGFIHGRAYDREYQFWQNAKDPLQYTARGRSPEGLPMRSNGLPFPLEQKVVDITCNPGRRVNRNGFIEAVGHLMWCSKIFWERTGVKHFTPEWVVDSRHSEGVDFFEMQELPFTEGDNSEELQDAIRAAFFPEPGQEAFKLPLEGFVDLPKRP